MAVVDPARHDDLFTELVKLEAERRGWYEVLALVRSLTHRTNDHSLGHLYMLTGRGETKKPKGSFLAPLIRKLRAG